MQPPVILAGPQSQSVPEGSDVSFTVLASGSGTLSYQWQHNGSNLAGATSSLLSLDQVPMAAAGTYTVLVSNAGGTVGSSASLTVTSVTVAPPVIVTGPQSQTVPVGSAVSFTVVASGSGTLMYQWQHNGLAIAGATRSALDLANVQLADAGTYTVVVSNAGGSASSSASLNVTTGTTVQPPVILSGPQSQTVPQGSAVNFTVVASGSGTLSYQWQHQGSNIAGATSSALDLAHVQLADAGTYTVLVSNLGGTVNSSASLTVTDWNHGATAGHPHRTAVADCTRGH